MKTKSLLLFLAVICCLRVQGTNGIYDPQILQEWKAFYQKYFRIDPDLSDISVPEYEDGFDRILVVAGGLTHQDVIEVMQRHFEMICVNVYVGNYYDHQILSIRDNIRSYAVRVRDTGTSGEYKKMATCVEKIPAMNDGLAINDMTLLERLIYELKFYDETGGHLDVEGFTVCCGSSFMKDSIALSPAVGWKTGAGAYYPPFLFISECYKAFTADGLYSRHVITSSEMVTEIRKPSDSLSWYRFPFAPNDQ